MQCEIPRNGFRCPIKPQPNWSQQQRSFVPGYALQPQRTAPKELGPRYPTPLRTAHPNIRKKPRPGDDRVGSNLKKMCARAPWMRFPQRGGVDFNEKAPKSRVLVREILPLGQVLLQDVENVDAKSESRYTAGPLTETQPWARSQSDRRVVNLWHAKLNVTNLPPEAEEILLYKEFDAVWQGENVVLFDGQFDMAPRLGARPRPSGDLPELNKTFPVTLVAWQGSYLAVQNKDIKRDLEFLDTFEKDPKAIVLRGIERRSYLLVWDNWRWKRAQVKDPECADGTILVNLIDEAVDKAVPKVEELLGIAPSTWRQPPAGGILIEMPEKLKSRFNVMDFMDEEVFCVLRKPVRNAKYSGQLFVKSADGKLVEIEDSFKAIEPSTPQLGLCFVMHVDHEQKKIHVVNSEVMDEHGPYLTEKIAEVKEKRPIIKVREGQAVLALMCDILCRAQVLKSQVDGHVVKFVDYGNSSLVPRVFAIPDELLSIPALAFSLPLNPNAEGQFEPGKVLTITSIEADSVRFIRL